MARSLYSPHPTYLDISIVLTVLITGCHASTDNEEISGVIAGSVVACLILVAAIAVIVYCVIKVQNAKKLKKKNMNPVHKELDHGTRVLRKIPTVQRGYPSIIGYSDYMIGYQTPFHNSRISMVSRVATISHMPIERPSLNEGFYSIPRPIKGKSVGERKSKQKFISRKKESVSPDRNRKYTDRWNEAESQFVLRKKEDPQPETKPTARHNEPYSLTSLFNQKQVPTQSADPYPKKEETRTNDILTSTLSYPSTYTNHQQASEAPIVYPPKLSSSKRYSTKNYSPKANPPVMYSPNMENVEGVESSETLRPDYPDYDLESEINENAPKENIPTEVFPKEDFPDEDVPSPKTNKFALPFTEELKQNSRFRASVPSISDSTAKPLSSSLKQVQFNSLSSSGIHSPTGTYPQNEVIYGDVPPPPPVPPP